MFIVALLMFASTSWAGPFEDASDAYERNDYATAPRLWLPFAVQGDVNAVKGRDIAARGMTPQQIGEAQKLARECQARNLKRCN